MNPKMLTSGLEIPGHETVDNIGLVRGIVVRSRSVVGTFAAGIQTFFGGNISIYTNMCEQARMDAYQIMCKQAEKNGANAVIGVRYDTTEIMAGVTEVYCYGTAVVVKKKSA
jgi:uncharacterized protein YbjQ (UPF0145 family)